MSLDFRNVPKDGFGIAVCSDLYDDFLGQYKEIPTSILIKAWQRAVLTGGPDPKHPTWRGVPLVIG